MGQGAGAAPSKVVNTALEIWRDDVNAKGGFPLREPDSDGPRDAESAHKQQRKMSNPVQSAPLRV